MFAVRWRRLLLARSISLLTVLPLPCGLAAANTVPHDDTGNGRRLPVVKNPALDHSGEPRRGKASYYGRQFFGRAMADGTPMDPEDNIAASRTLPLGTKALVTNLGNGKSVMVEIRDRGPYIAGRIVDVTPKAARQLGFKKEGLALVEVTPLEVPMPDGSVKPGVAASAPTPPGRQRLTCCRRDADSTRTRTHRHLMQASAAPLQWRSGANPGSMKTGTMKIDFTYHLPPCSRLITSNLANTLH